MDRVGILALVFIGLLAYCNAIRHPFVHDDVIFILQNPQITDFNHPLEVFDVKHSLGGMNVYYRPVLEFLYRLEYFLFGPHPFGFHVFNIIVHVANGILLFGLLQRLDFRRSVAWLIACIFLIHPVQTEAVSCISGISNLWMTLGILLALHAYLNNWYTATLFCFLMAFLSKEQAVIFIPLVMVIDFSRGAAKNYGSWIFFGLFTGILLWLRQCVTGVSLLKDIMVSPGEFYLRLAAIPRDLEMYLRLIFCPYDLHYYRNTDILHSNGLAWALAFIFLAGIGYIFQAYPKTRPRLFLGLGWFLATLLPVLNITSLVNEYSFILTSEHFLYLPIVGILMIVVSAADHYIKHYRKLFLGAVLTVCLLLTWYQNTFWRSEIALFERMLRFEPDFGRGHLLLAKAYYFNGRPQEADPHFKKAFEIMSGYMKKADNATAKNFYKVLTKEILFDWAGNDSAMGYWQRALDKYRLAATIDEEDASLYNNMAFVYLHMGDKKDAYLSLKQALRVNPSFTQARINLRQLGPP